MPTTIDIFNDAEDLGHAVAERIADQLTAAAAQGRRYILGCPGGRTARSTYAALAHAVHARGLALDHLVIAMMDEYLEPANGGFRRIAADAHNSCRRFAEREIVAPLNAATTTPIPTEHIWLPDPAHPEAYDAQLAAAGGIDLFLLASGESDGHVAFNPPGSHVDSRTRVVELADTTRQDNMHTFPAFASITEVPTHGVTVGIGTISKVANELVMILTGTHKRTAFARITEQTDYDPAWPSTVIHLGAKATIAADRAAASTQPTTQG